LLTSRLKNAQRHSELESYQTHKQDCEKDSVTCMEIKVLPPLINIKPVFSYVPAVPLTKG